MKGWNAIYIILGIGRALLIILVGVMNKNQVMVPLAEAHKSKIDGDARNFAGSVPLGELHAQKATIEFD